MAKIDKKNSINRITDYKARLKELREYYNFSFDARQRMTPARKAAIGRAENRYQKNLKPVLDAGGTFEKATRTTRRDVKGAGGDNAISTPKGYALAPQKNSDSVKWDKKTKSIVTTKGEAVFRTYQLKDPVAFARDPDKVLKKLPNYKKAIGVRVNVGEGQFMGNLQYDPIQINRYITDELPNTSNGGKTPDEFIFAVTLVFMEKPKNGNKKKSNRRARPGNRPVQSRKTS